MPNKNPHAKTTYCWLLATLLLLLTPLTHAHTLQSGDLTATCDPQQGITQLKRNGQILLTGSTTAVFGHQFTLTRNVPDRDWNWPANKDTCHFAPSVGRLIARLGNRSKHTTEVLTAQTDRYTIRHTYHNGITLIFDHQLQNADMTLKITLENNTQDLFQLHDWLALDLHFDNKPKITQKMSSYYPAAEVYSPVTALWDNQQGIGINWIKHDFRPVEIRLHPRPRNNPRKLSPQNTSSKQNPSKYQYHLKTWMKNAPVEAGGRASHTMVLRTGSTDWKKLLLPYKKWFNQYLGPVQYNPDFRVKVATFCSNSSLITPTNSQGMRQGLDRQGWQAFLNKRLGHLQTYNVGHTLIWGATGASSRGVNYRPEFDVFPPVMTQGMPQLRDFFTQLGHKKFGFFARPNTLAYRKSWSKDADVEFHAVDPQHARMADTRFKKLIDQGATAFYLDTYGSATGCTPGSARATVFYLKRLRELAGPEKLIVTEHGFDGYHIFAAIWPVGKDKLGKKPLGAFARWLTLGSVEICRVHNIQGAQRTWVQGGIPILNDVSINAALMQMQKQYVNPDGSSRVRKDCLPPLNVATSPLAPAHPTPQAPQPPLPTPPSSPSTLFRR